MTTPSVLVRRRIGRVALAVSCLFAGTFALWACGPFFPRWLLGSERLLVLAPEGLLRHEIDRLKLADTPRAVPADDPWQQTTEAGVADLRKALDAAKVPAARRDPLVARYTEVRTALSKYSSAVIVFENVSEPLYPEEEGMGDEEPSEPAVFPENLSIPEGLPGEFADYLRGAIAYHKGDLKAAISAWKALLERPEGERRFRSTWAAFMLGKAQMRAERPAEGVRWFERTREIAGQKDFEDSLGLASASLGWEARAERDLGHFDKALALYARQAKGGDPTSLSSLRFVARQAFKAGPDALAPIARSAEARAVLTGFLVSDAKAPWEDWLLDEAEADPATAEFPAHVSAWLAALQKAGVKEVDGADRIAWAAYQGGDFAAARQWLDRAPADAPMARWVRAKLLLRGGKLAEAQKLLEEAATTLPDPRLTEDEVYLHSEGSDGGKIATPSLATAESAALLTTQGKYVDALDRFLKSGFWIDAAHLAEQVLTVDELKAYVDGHWPASLVKDLSEEWYSYNEGLETAPSNHLARDLRYLLGRRLVRAGRLEEAQPYLPAEMETFLGSLRGALLHSEEPGQPADRRAAAYFRAACVTRKQGLELLGTELDPDWFLFEGQYEMNYRDEMAERAENPHLKPGPGEIEKAESARPQPDLRFHYRYRAAELARKAAALLPDGSDEKARYLATAGTWLKARDPEAARPFFKALLDCCSETALGQEAQQVKWFPEVPECAVE